MNTDKVQKSPAQAHESKELHSVKNIIKDIHAAYTPLGSVTSVSFRGLWATSVNSVLLCALWETETSNASHVRRLIKRKSLSLREKCKGMNTDKVQKSPAQALQIKELHSVKNIIKDIQAACTPLGSVTSVSFRGLWATSVNSVLLCALWETETSNASHVRHLIKRKLLSLTEECKGMNTGRGKKRSAQAHESKEIHSVKNIIKDIQAACTPLGSVISVSFRGLWGHSVNSVLLCALWETETSNVSHVRRLIKRKSLSLTE